jgi:hypothetical protein
MNIETTLGFACFNSAAALLWAGYLRSLRLLDDSFAGMIMVLALAIGIVLPGMYVAALCRKNLGLTPWLTRAASYWVVVGAMTSMGLWIVPVASSPMWLAGGFAFIGILLLIEQGDTTTTVMRRLKRKVDEELTELETQSLTPVTPAGPVPYVDGDEKN